MALIKEYFELTRKYKNEYGEKTIVLMQVGAFFEVYGLKNNNSDKISGSEIIIFSQICDLNIADKKTCVGHESVVMAGFSTYMIDKYLRKLQDDGCTVVVYVQDEQAKNTTRSLNGIYSPGTYFFPDNVHITNNTTCIWLNVVNMNNSILNKRSCNPKNNQIIRVGISNIDIYTGKTSIFEFKEIYIHSPSTFDELERFISIYQPSEVIVISSNILSNNQIDDIINYSGINCNSIHKINLDENEKHKASNCEKQVYQKELLKKFYKINDYDIFIQNFYENMIALQSFCFLLDFIYQHNPNLINKISEPIFENCSDRLILANHSLKQLNIINDKDNYKGIYSVEKMLNIATTPMGKRRFSYLFLNPTTNIDYLENEYSITEYFMNNHNDYDFLKTKLGMIKDIPKINRLIINKKLTPKMLFHLYQNLNIIKEIFMKISEDETIISYLNLNNGESSRENNSQNIDYCCEYIISFLEKQIDFDLCKDIDIYQNYDINFFNKGNNPILDKETEILMDSIDKLNAISNYFNNIISKYEKKTKTADFIKIHETEKNSFSIISTKRRCSILKKIIEGYPDNHFQKLEYNSSFNNENKTFIFNVSSKTLLFSTQSASNESISTIEIKELCQNITNSKIKLKDLLTQVYFSEILTKLEEDSNQDKLNHVIEFITKIDIIYSKSQIAIKYNYCRPKIEKSEKSFVIAKGIRHCLIENIQQNELYVTNDIELGINKNDGILLYGTNAVGKTSLIKSIGISIIMAQSGLFVPCSNFSYYPYKYIFTRILGNDNIFKGLSTFAVEMTELRTILRLSNENSLILGDELCSGTESISAKSIFVAGVNKLSEKRSSYIFATHLHEIINYDEIIGLETLSLKHMEVIYDKERDILIYDRKLKDGPGNNMYGLEVCRSLNLPVDFLELANNIRIKYNEGTGSILSLKTSHYNSKKIMNLCELCNIELTTEVHHIQPQRIANEHGIIKNSDGSVFHKNNKANLLGLCESCHNKMHSSEYNDSKMKLFKTTTGYILGKN